MSRVPLSLFKELISAKLQVLLEEGPVQIELIDVKVYQASPGWERFTLRLRGPLDFLLPQQTYMFRHERFGEEPMFMVPVGQRPDGYLYEMVFQRTTEVNGGEN
ncbi:hypothetical protein LJK87_45685 [Paenibacillus sp. P25]|nr:hypothetical protein LJK87_45685 [Paenibacillus sp. P25]